MNLHPADRYQDVDEPTNAHNKGRQINQQQPQIPQNLYDEANSLATLLQNAPRADRGIPPYFTIAQNDLHPEELKLFLRALMANVYLVAHAHIATYETIDGATKTVLVRDADTEYWRNPMSRIQLGAITAIRIENLPRFALTLANKRKKDTARKTTRSE